MYSNDVHAIPRPENFFVHSLNFSEHRAWRHDVCDTKLSREHQPTFVGATYTHLATLGLFPESCSIRIIASSNNTVFPLPVGAVGVYQGIFDR